jgi:UrcA family protein
MNAIVAKSIITIAVSVVLTGCSVPADARDRESAGPVRSVIVRYAELDLSKPQGIAVLYGRIQTAAQRVCRADSSAYGLYDRANYSKCYRAAVERAVSQVNLLTLTALHRAKTSSTVG